MTTPVLKCATCGRVGKVTGQYMEVGGSDPDTYLERVDGLDLENCPGCRIAVHESGLMVAVFSVRGIDPAAESA